MNDTEQLDKILKQYSTDAQQGNAEAGLNLAKERILALQPHPVPTPVDGELREKIQMYVAGSASSGKNFTVASEPLAVSQEVQDGYVDSLLRLFVAHLQAAAQGARENELARIIGIYENYLTVTAQSQHIPDDEFNRGVKQTIENELSARKEELQQLKKGTER